MIPDWRSAEEASAVACRPVIRGRQARKTRWLRCCEQRKDISKLRAAKQDDIIASASVQIISNTIGDQQIITRAAIQRVTASIAKHAIRTSDADRGFNDHAARIGNIVRQAANGRKELERLD